MRPRILVSAVFLFSLLVPLVCLAQVTGADYERAAKLRDKYQGLAVNIPEAANAIEGTHRFWYRKSVKGGNEFVVVDANTLVKKPAFDHERLAASLSAAAGQTYSAVTLPFNTFRFTNNENEITFGAGGSNWSCGLADYACKNTGPAAGQGQRGNNPAVDPDEDPTEFVNDVEDGMTFILPQQGQRGAGTGAGNQAQNNPKASPD